MTTTRHLDVPRAAARDAHRRGSVYVAVLGVSMLLGVIGIAGVTMARLETGRVTASQRVAHADAYAQSMIDLALHRLAEDANWRTAYAHGVENAGFTVDFGQGSLANGQATYTLLDEADGDLADDAGDTVRLRVKAESGDACRIYSVELNGVTLRRVVGTFRRETR